MAARKHSHNHMNALLCVLLGAYSQSSAMRDVCIRCLVTMRRFPRVSSDVGNARPTHADQAICPDARLFNMIVWANTAELQIGIDDGKRDAV